MDRVDPDTRSRLAQRIFETTTDAVVGITEDQRVAVFNPGAERVFGYREEEIVGQPLEVLIDPARATQHRVHIEEFLGSGEKARDMAERSEVRGRRKSGETFPAAATIMRVDLRKGTYLVAVVNDLSNLRQLQEELRSLADAVEHSGDLVVITDVEGTIEYVNPAFEEATGYRSEEAVGKPVSEVLKSGRHGPEFYAELWATLKRGGIYRNVVTDRAKDGRLLHLDQTISPIFDQEGEIRRYVAIGRDFSERLELEERLRGLAYKDPLTGLPNRHLFYDRLTHALRRAHRNGQGLAVVFIDLDGFKPVNDSYGHSVGDAVLEAVGERLSGIVREEDTLARLGGDEFLVMLERLPRSEDAAAASAEEAAQRVLEGFRQPFEVEGASIGLDASVGVALYPHHGAETEALIHNADLAMYAAKVTGDRRWALYRPEYADSGPAE